MKGLFLTCVLSTCLAMPVSAWAADQAPAPDTPVMAPSPHVAKVEMAAIQFQLTEIQASLRRIEQTAKRSAQAAKPASTTCLWEDKVFTLGAVSHNKVCDIDQLGKSVPEWIDIPSDVSGPR